MKNLSTTALLAGVLSCSAVVFAQATAAQTNNAHSGAQQPLTAGGCIGCSQKAELAGDASKVVFSRPIPGSNENMVVGRIENLIPIGVLTVLGCEKCAEEAIGWALQQGSSFEDIDRTLGTVAAMQKLDCFNQQFGPEVVSRMEKPLAAAKRALQQAMDRAGK
jgi:hypothetical protein